MRKRQEGFTLLELVVVMFCSTIVIGAAMTVLLSGLRVEKKTQEGLSSQQTAHTILTLVERLTSDGKVSAVETVGDTGWMLLDDGNSPLLAYNNGSGTLTATGGTVLMEGVTSAGAELSEDNLLTVSLETEGETYTVKSFCRTAVAETALNEDALDNLLEDLTTGDESGRAAFLLALATQYGSDGQILGRDPEEDRYIYFSEWYIGGYEGRPDWSQDTPWCACFLSWALYKIQQEAAEAGGSYLKEVPRFADVDAGKAWFEARGRWIDRTDGDIPIPGDLVFFDWSGGNDPAHVGAVFYVDETNGVFYTIEGNSGGRVRLHVYPLRSKVVIGYGILDWDTTDRIIEK